MSRHRLRDDDDGIARWLVREPPERQASATGKFWNRPRDATARDVRVRVGS